MATRKARIGLRSDRRGQGKATGCHGVHSALRQLLGTLLIGYSVCLWLLSDIISPPTRMTLSCVHCLTVKVTSPLKSATKMSLSSVKTHPSCALWREAVFWTNCSTRSAWKPRETAADSGCVLLSWGRWERRAQSWLPAKHRSLVKSCLS